MFGGPRASDCTHHTLLSHRGRTHDPVCGRLWPHTSMEAPVCARMASARGVFVTQKSWGDSWRRFAPTTSGRRVVDAHCTRGLDFYGQILLWPLKYAHEWPVKSALMEYRKVGGTSGVGSHPRHAVVTSWTQAVRLVWTSIVRCIYGHPSTRTNGHCKRRSWDTEMLNNPRQRFPRTTPGGHVVDASRTPGLDFRGQMLLWPPKYEHEWPVQAAWLGYKDVGGTPGCGSHPPHPVVASWTHTVRVVWTSMARYFYGHPSTRTNGQCKRRVWDEEMLEGPPASVCNHHIRWSRRGRTPYAWFGLLWPDASMATQIRARMASASGVAGIQRCWGDPRLRFAATTPGGRVVDAHRTRVLDFDGQILQWPPEFAHKWPVQAAWSGYRNIGRTPGVGLHQAHPVVASWTQAVRVV